jgi:hypothetical protein
MSHLAVVVREYCEQPGVTARDLELRAGVPGATISHIMRDSHPRPERLGQLIRALDDATARRWLIAYLRDDCPPEYLPRLQILITEFDGSTVQEPGTAYLVPLDHGPAAVLAAWQRLQTAMEADTSLGRWFVQTVNLILGPL